MIKNLVYDGSDVYLLGPSSTSNISYCLSFRDVCNPSVRRVIWRMLNHFEYAGIWKVFFVSFIAKIGHLFSFNDLKKQAIQMVSIASNPERYEGFFRIARFTWNLIYISTTALMWRSDSSSCSWVLRKRQWEPASTVLLFFKLDVWTKNLDKFQETHLAFKYSVSTELISIQLHISCSGVFFLKFESWKKRNFTPFGVPSLHSVQNANIAS